jgi:hypothetical protein
MQPLHRSVVMPTLIMTQSKVHLLTILAQGFIVRSRRCRLTEQGRQALEAARGILATLQNQIEPCTKGLIAPFTDPQIRLAAQMMESMINAARGQNLTAEGWQTIHDAGELLDQLRGLQQFRKPRRCRSL